MPCHSECESQCRSAMPCHSQCSTQHDTVETVPRKTDAPCQASEPKGKLVTRKQNCKLSPEKGKLWQQHTCTTALKASIANINCKLGCCSWAHHKERRVMPTAKATQQPHARPGYQATAVAAAARRQMAAHPAMAGSGATRTVHHDLM